MTIFLWCNRWHDNIQSAWKSALLVVKEGEIYFLQEHALLWLTKNKNGSFGFSTVPFFAFHFKTRFISQNLKSQHRTYQGFLSLISQLMPLLNNDRITCTKESVSHKGSSKAFKLPQFFFSIKCQAEKKKKKEKEFTLFYDNCNIQPKRKPDESLKKI